MNIQWVVAGAIDGAIEGEIERDSGGSVGFVGAIGGNVGLIVCGVFDGDLLQL